MPISTTIFSIIRNATATGTFFLVAVGIASAEVYDFNRFVRGGGGGLDPAKQRIVTGAGAFICVDIRGSRVPPASRVLFTFWSQMPDPKSRVAHIVFDTGRHTDLFGNVSILVQSPGLRAKVAPPKSHAMLHGLAPDYWIALPYPDGITPRKSVVVAATLASGKTFANVISALNEGLNPATATTGLRVGVIASHILGGPPPGVATIYDDGGFILTGISSRCRTS